MKQKFKNYIIPFIKEIIPVVVGILIALFINNWNDQRKDKSYISQVFSTINSELSETNDEIKEIIPLQESLIDSIEINSNNSKASILDIVMKSRGIKIPKIKINAWKSVSSSKIDLVSYKKVTALSDIEEQKDILKDKTEFLMNFLYSNFHETEKSKKETLKMIIKDIVQTEKTIEQQIEYFRKE